MVNFSLQHQEEYKKILAAVKGEDGEKRLAAQFIPRFFKYFPDLAESAINSQLDLCEDDNSAVSENFSQSILPFSMTNSNVIFS